MTTPEHDSNQEEIIDLESFENASEESITSEVEPVASQTTTETPPRRQFRWESFSFLFLLLVLLIGGYFRFTGLNWDENYHLHPDERFLTWVASSLQPVSNPLAYLRTSESTLNPYNHNFGFYVYGNFPMTATRTLAGWTLSACERLLVDEETPACPLNVTGYDGVHVFGRFLSGLVDLVAILFTFLIGRRLYDWRAGLLASLLLAMAVQPIQQAHYFTMDNWSAALTTLTIYTAVRAAGLGDETVRWRLHWWVLFGLSFGLDVASRINVAPLALMVNVAALIYLVRRGHTPKSIFKTPRGSLDLHRVILGVLLAAVVSIFNIILAQP
jgi:hypothetical protein